MWEQANDMFATEQRCFQEFTYEVSDLLNDEPLHTKAPIDHHTH